MENSGFETINQDTENIENIKYHYVYTNVDIPGRPVIFDCDASDLAEANDLYEKKLGIKPALNESIGLSII